MQSTTPPAWYKVNQPIRIGYLLSFRNRESLYLVESPQVLPFRTGAEFDAVVYGLFELIPS